MNRCVECKHLRSIFGHGSLIPVCDKQRRIVTEHEDTSDCKDFEQDIDIMDCTDESSPMSD
jgi:hypothetical protein